mgnify:CR=1 FL=1
MVERENTQAAFEGQKPPVTIISDSPTTTVDTQGGTVNGLAPRTEGAALAEAASRATGYTVAAIVAGVIGVIWVVVKRFGRKR